MSQPEPRELDERALDNVIGGSRAIPPENSTIYYVIDASGSMSKPARRESVVLGGFPDPFVDAT